MRIGIAGILLCVISVCARAQHTSHVFSSELKAIQNRVAAGDKTAIDAFWNQIAREGVPLIEAVSGSPDHFLVTLVYRGSETTRNVAIIGGFVVGWQPEERFAKDQAMMRLGDTNIWYKTFKVRGNARVSYLLSENEPLLDGVRGQETHRENWHADALNPRRFFFAQDPNGPKLGVAEVSYVELPAAPSLRWSKIRPATPGGRLKELQFESTVLANSRRVWIYTPPNFKPDEGPYDLLLLFDGWEYTHWIPTPTILNNLIADRLIRPTVAAMIESRDRGRELTGSSQFVTFLSDELVPFLRKNYAVTSDPARTVVGGASLGGLAASYTALRKPQIFGNVLSQSGSYWWISPDDHQPKDPVREFRSSPHLSIRFYVEVGALEDYPDPSHPSQLKSNRDFCEVLQAKGYDLKYFEFNGRHEFVNWEASLPEALVLLLGTKKTELTPHCPGP